MFKIEYEIILNEWDDFPGQNGFFRIIWNEYAYGEVYEDVKKSDLLQESIFDWFERLVKVMNLLKKKEYVALSDTESHNTWMEFIRKGDDLFINVAEAKKDGLGDIVFELEKPIIILKSTKPVLFSRFCTEISNKVINYNQDLFNIRNTGFNHIEQGG